MEPKINYGVSIIDSKETINNPHPDHLRAIASEAHQSVKNVELQHKLDHDELVPNLLNKKGFAKHLEEKLSVKKGPFAIVYFDAKRFKAINDTYNHAEGDKVLIAIAKAVEGASRNSPVHTYNGTTVVNNDLISRQSGDEFCSAIFPMGNGKFQSKSSALTSAEIYVRRINAILSEGVKVIDKNGEVHIIKVELTAGIYVGDNTEEENSNKSNEEIVKDSISKADDEMHKHKNPNDRNEPVIVLKKLAKE